MGRRLRSLLPTTNKQFLPQTVNHCEARKKMEKIQLISKKHYDKNAHEMNPTNIGESVRIQKKVLGTSQGYNPS
jgi:hypothetical protein